jgi:hypothetical protein
MGQFDRDEDRCRDRARETPRVVTPRSPLIILKEPDTRGMTPAEAHEANRRWHQRLQYGLGTVTSPEMAYDECMSEAGWVDPRHWQAGRR